MNKCLVTKLSGSCSNQDLLRIGEMRIAISKVDSPNQGTQGFSINVSKPVELQIIGDGYFTDKTLTENNGKKKIVNPNIDGNSTPILVSNGNFSIAILDKYSITSIAVSFRGLDANLYFGSNKYFDIKDLMYSKSLTGLLFPDSPVDGDINAVKDLNSLVSIVLYGTQVSGDVSSLKSLMNLRTLSLNNTKVSGDVSSLKSLTSLTSLSFNNTQVSGDVSSLKSLTSLTSLSFNDTQISGDVSSLKSLTSLRTLTFNGNLTGDIAILPKSLSFLSIQKCTSSFSWSNRDSSSKIMAIDGGNATIDNIDKMLQDQSECQIGFSSNSPAWQKTITVKGNRTSASDSAVAKLQEKGYTIIISKE